MDFASTARRRPQELVASSFVKFYRQQHQCLYVSTVPSKSRRKDNSALLECAKEGQEFELCKSTLKHRNGTYSATTVSSLVRFFHDLAAFTSRESCKSHSFLVTSLKIELEDSEELYFSAKEKKL